MHCPTILFEMNASIKGNDRPKSREKENESLSATMTDRSKGS
jgi:hypothetical protein